MSPIKSTPVRVLALGTANSTRSILCEALINHYGHNQWRAFSAGSHAGSAVHAAALQTLQAHHVGTAGLRSKSWDEFADAGAPRLDIVIAVCDDADETCPAWPGSPLKIHWDIPDPAAAGADQQAKEFETAFMTLQRRVRRMVELPVPTLDRDILQTELRKLGIIF